MSSRYLEMVRGQRRRGGWQFTSKSLLAILAFIAMIGSAVYWWGVQSQLTGNWIIAAAYTAILVLAPPSLMSFLIPWSPGGMLLQKINAKTWGYAVVIAATIYLVYYSFEIQWTWWASQPVVQSTGLVIQQVLIGIIGFIIIPALLWTPVTSEELVEQVRQAHLVRRYELQTQADIAILRATLLRAQEKALIGFANLTVQEREELAAVMRGLVKGIDATLRDIGESVRTVSGATVPFNSLEDNEDIQKYLDFVAETLTDNALLPRRSSATGQHEAATRQLSSREEEEYYEDDRRTRALRQR
ncbi:histidine kinase [Chloroflexus islandicus]|uniref:Histidine kinase n=1 Tax=Chloroflexus islandicus TaxID=1707952 RepID=A0A178MEX8_9CHLR|nr:histidine kinase [Chloroflexus islandicus]OAN47076.1 histidine kinase [Chloroflexus islandicus]